MADINQTKVGNGQNKTNQAARLSKTSPTTSGTSLNANSKKPDAGGPNLTEMPKLENTFSGMDFVNKKFWMIFGGIVTLILIAIFVFSFLVIRKEPSSSVSQSPEIAQNALEQSPVALPAIKENNEVANPLKDYFKSVSSNFQDSFMTNVPEIAPDAYKKYLDAPEGDEKLEAARAFYIYLNNPGSYKDDPSYQQFLSDVKSDLENTLSRNLFGE